ncbi:MAG: hypothetical protein CMM44_08665 [Rhodospirillaceae bacterium]|nr:hypothetical protein [Rhodospirillaceae bacterium]|tara:strand:+ start:1176 stop:2315 length:1140 start_codon:yes stop_codon:yes gene_type:complete
MMSEKKEKQSRLFSVWVRPTTSGNCYQWPMGFDPDGTFIYVQFVDQPRLVAFKPGIQSIQQLIKKVLRNSCTIDKILEGEAAVHDLLELATPDTLRLYQNAEKEVTKKGQALCNEISALLRSAARVASNIECLSWSLQDIDAASIIDELVKNIHGPVKELEVLGVGGGIFSQNIIKRFIGLGLRHFTVASKSEAEAKNFALSNGGHFSELERIELLLPDADVVVTDVGDGRVWILADDVKRALRRRRHKPLLIIDGGIPSDVAPSVDRIEDAYVFSIDDLERMAMEKLGGSVTEKKRTDLVKTESSVLQEVLSSNQVSDAFIKMTEKSPEWIKERLTELSNADGILPLAVRDAITLLFGNSSNQKVERDKKKRDNDAYL